MRIAVLAFAALARSRALRVVAAVPAALSFAVPQLAQAQGRPAIEHIEPTSGPPGTRVQIVGRNFRSAARVLYGERELSIVERGPERLTVELPAGAASGRFVVAHGADEVESEVFRVTDPPPAPRVLRVEPLSAAPGAEVTLRGENFGARPGDNTVRIGTLAMVVRSADATTLRVVVPDGATSGAIVVRTLGGESSSPVLAVAQRVFVREFAPTAASPGQRVTLRGSGFGNDAAAVHVSLGNRPLRVLSANGDNVEVEVPRDATQGGTFSVEVRGAGRFETGSALRVAPAPVISAVDPQRAAPGARVTLRGERFGTDMTQVRVSLGETPVNVLRVAPTELVLAVPRGAGGGRFALTVAGIGPVEAPADFTVLEPVSIAGVRPGAADVGDRVTVTGTGFSPTPSENTVLLGNQPANVVSVAGRELVFEVPPGAHSGLLTVRVTGNGEGRTAQPFMITQRPRITQMDPDRAIVGSRVTLRGQNLPTEIGLVQVRLGDVECEVNSVSSDGIVVTVPRGLQPGPVRFTVVVRLQGSGRAENEFFVLVPSRIASIDPPAAPPGARITVRGEGFETDVRQLRARIGTSALRVVSATTTELQLELPRAVSSGDLVLEAPLRQTASAPMRIQAQPALTAFAPALGSPGTRVTLRGRNLGADVARVQVTLGSERCSVLEARGDSLVVEVPSGASTGRFTVTVQEQGAASAPRDFRITTSRPR